MEDFASIMSAILAEEARSMSWDDGTGKDVLARREDDVQYPLEFESVSGDRFAPGFETPGSRSTGADKRRTATTPSTGRSVFPQRLTDRAAPKTPAVSQSVS